MHEPTIGDLKKAAPDLLRIVHEAIENFDSASDVEAKGYRDIVTNTDVRLERELGQYLTKMLPGTGVRGEELGEQLSSVSNMYWVLDPVDGTINFSRGLPLFTSSLALVKDSEPIAAAVMDPTRQVIMIASQGSGCVRAEYDQGEQIAWHDATTQARDFDLAVASIMVTPKMTESVRSASTALIEHLLSDTLGVRLLVSQAQESALLADGGLDLVLSLRSSGGWARDASRLIAVEAGGLYALTRSRLDEDVTGFALVAHEGLVDPLRRLLDLVDYELEVGQES